MEWEGNEEEAEHSVVDGKLAELTGTSSRFSPGANVQCKLKEGMFTATILATGVSLCASESALLGYIVGCVEGVVSKLYY